MGYGSHYEDDLDAKGESAKGSVRVRTKEAKAVKKEVPTYEFDGTPLTQYVAETILTQWAIKESTYVRGEKSSWLTVAKWAEYMRAYHEQNGGKPPAEDLVNIVAQALISLDRKGYARQMARDNSTGKWKLFQRKLQ